MANLLFDVLERIILNRLEDFPEGLSEYALLKWLESQAEGLPIERDDSDQLTLFRSHFILYHLLYRLQGRLHTERRGSLSISPLCIRIEADSLSGVGLIEHDPLRAYYLDLAELERTTADDVATLLDSFWRRLEAWHACRGALEVLGFIDEVPEFAEVRRRYRQLCMRHHPDRGGDTTTLQTINEAMAQLERIYAR